MSLKLDDGEFNIVSYLMNTEADMVTLTSRVLHNFYEPLVLLGVLNVAVRNDLVSHLYPVFGSLDAQLCIYIERYQMCG